MRPALIVLSPPCLQLLPGVRQIVEPVHVQAFVPKAAVERLDERIVRRLSGPGELQGHTVGIGPQIDQAADELAAVVAVNPLRNTAFGGDPAQHVDHVGTS